MLLYKRRERVGKQSVENCNKTHKGIVEMYKNLKYQIYLLLNHVKGNGKTVIGKILTALIAILGIGMFALPAGILVSEFSDEFQKRKNKEKNICLHCGKIENFKKHNKL